MTTTTAPAMTEAQLLSAVRDLCKLLGFMAYHTYRSDRSEAGFPDLTMVGRDRVLFRELKTAKGRVTPAQQAWLDALAAAGADAGVWRPEHLVSGQIAAELTHPRKGTP